MAYVPTIYETPPDENVTYVGRPVFGRSVASLGNGQKNMLGFRGLRYISQIVDYDTTNQDAPPAPGPGTSIKYSPRMRFVVSPLARYLWVGFYASMFDQRATGVSVILNIETPAGVVVDGPFTFDGGNGRGVGRNYGLVDDLANIGGRDSLYHTGWRKEVPGTTTPRLIDLDGYAGMDVVIYLTLAGARVHSMFALEVYQPQVEMNPLARLVINEIDYDNVGGDTMEFVEIYNAGNADQDLTNITLRYWDSTETNVHSHSLNIGSCVMVPGERLILGSAALIATLPASVTKTITLATSHLNNFSAGLTIEDTVTGFRFDGVAWESGGTAMTTIKEGTILPPDAGDARSYQRYPGDGYDTQDNASDFHLATPQPGLPNI